MVADLIVNTRLMEFGFDLRKDYETEVLETKSQLEGFQTSPTDRFLRMLWTVNYVSYLLDWELLNGTESESEFQLWFDARFPDTAERGQKLYQMVKRIGYDTPEKQTRLFREIIRRYNLERFLVF